MGKLWLIALKKKSFFSSPLGIFFEFLVFALFKAYLF